jgi:hypothetical protein
MSDTNSESALPSSSLSLPSGTLGVPQTDWFLQHLVEYSNNLGISVAITVQVGGMLVTGQIMSHTEYFNETADEFKTSLNYNSDLAESFFGLIKSYNELVHVPNEGEAPLPPNYIHIRDAKIFTAGNFNNAVVVRQWRGRISEIGGFFIGTVTPKD